MSLGLSIGERIPLTTTSSLNADAVIVAANLRRMMARDNLTFENVVAATELDERTLRSLARGAANPHARTLHKLAQGLGVPIDELFRPPGHVSPRQFDRATNSLEENFAAQHPETFRNWSQADFDELYSRFGTGGQLTEDGISAAAEATNLKRDLWRRISVILESGETELLTQVVDVLYRRAAAPSPSGRGLG